MALIEIWNQCRERIKLMRCWIKDEESKRDHGGILLEGLKQLIETNSGNLETICELIRNKGKSKCLD